MTNVTSLKSQSQSQIVEHVSANKPGWADHKIEAWDADKLDKLMPFVKSHYWSDRHSINVFSVVGTAHPDYAGLTWCEFLHEGKRMRENQYLLGTNPIYYDLTEVKDPSMLYVSLNGKHWYVNGDGNHRTCLARFHFDRLNLLHNQTKTMIHGVTTDDYRVDWDLYYLFEKLQQALDKNGDGARIEVVRQHRVRQDGPGWKIDKFTSSLKLISRKGDVLLTRAEAERKLAVLNSSGIIRLADWFKW